jgi:hypothetical protein
MLSLFPSTPTAGLSIKRYATALQDGDPFHRRNLLKFAEIRIGASWLRDRNGVIRYTADYT